ncbi:hypothetical protein ACYSUO_39520 [Streptomyces sp. UC4497]
MLLRLTYLPVTNAFAMLRLLPASDRDKKTEILALHHQLGFLQRPLDGQRLRLHAADRAFLAALLTPLPRATLRRLQLPISPDTVLRRHRDLIKHRRARCKYWPTPRPSTHPHLETPPVPRLAAENPSLGIPPHPRRTPPRRRPGRTIHRLGDPQN